MEHGGIIEDDEDYRSAFRLAFGIIELQARLSSVNEVILVTGPSAAGRLRFIQEATKLSSVNLESINEFPGRYASASCFVHFELIIPQGSME